MKTFDRKATQVTKEPQPPKQGLSGTPKGSQPDPKPARAGREPLPTSRWGLNEPARQTLPVSTPVSGEKTKGSTSNAGAGGPRLRSVQFEVFAPKARNVQLVGSFNDWNPARTPMRSLGEGRWRTELTLEAGRHEYLFLVDDQWTPDPQARSWATNPFGGRNSAVEVF